MPSSHVVPTFNRLLAALPSQDYRHLLAGCEEVALAMGHILAEPGQTIAASYFPTDSFISLVMPLDGGWGMEVGLVGNEGMVGIPLMLGVDVAPFHVLVQGAGPALRIPAALFEAELEQSAALRQILQRYVYVTMRQLAQTAACTRFHLVEQRLARWLLMTSDRAHSDEFHITHEFLAQMLGVRRVGVTKAAGSLHKKNLISYSRGNVRIHDIAGLEAASCSCYQADKEVYGRIMGG